MVSLIVPVYNSELYIKECIQSIKDQKLKDWECIIINDGSSDNSLQIISNEIDNRFKLINLTENKGVGYCRNLGIQEAKGNYLCFLDSDDIICPEYTFNAQKFLDDNLKYSLYYGKVKYFFEDGNSFIETPLWRGYKEMLRVDCISVTSVIRNDRKIFFNEDLEANEDYDFYIRYLLDNDRVKISDEVGFLYRQRSDSRHHLRPKGIKDKIKLLNKEIYDRYFNSTSC